MSPVRPSPIPPSEERHPELPERCSSTGRRCPQRTSRHAARRRPGCRRCSGPIDDPQSRLRRRRPGARQPCPAPEGTCLARVCLARVARGHQGDCPASPRRHPSEVVGRWWGLTPGRRLPERLPADPGARTAARQQGAGNGGHVRRHGPEVAPPERERPWMPPPSRGGCLRSVGGQQHRSVLTVDQRRSAQGRADRRTGVAQQPGTLSVSVIANESSRCTTTPSSSVVSTRAW